MKLSGLDDWLTRGALAVLGVSAIVFAFALMSAIPGGAQTGSKAEAADTTLGIDVTTDGNDAATIGTIDTCKRVEVNGTFDVDVYITDVSGLRGWNMLVNYDKTKLSVTAHTMMMIHQYESSDPEPDSDGSDTLGAGNANLGTVSGSGVLVRLTMSAIAAGSSPVYIAYSPVGPELDGDNGAIGDTNNDMYFDGTVNAAKIAIGQDCDSGPVETPTPGPTLTQAPTPTPVPTPTPTATPNPSNGIQGDADCSGHVDTPDVIDTLAGAAQVGASAGCSTRGDTNCDGHLDANDALRILRFITQEALGAPIDCPLVGDPLS